MCVCVCVKYYAMKTDIIRYYYQTQKDINFVTLDTNK